MSNDTTQKLPGGPSSFEERVFARFDALDARLQALENQGERFDARLRALEDQGNQFDACLHTLETQAEQRAVETKPIWERALAEILEVKEEILEVKEKLDDLDRKFSIVTEDIIQVRADQVRLERRIDRLEPKPTH